MSEKGDVMPAEAGVMCFELGGRGHEPRSVGSCWKLQKPGDELSLEPSEEIQSGCTLILAPKTHFKLWPPELYNDKFVMF